MISKKHRCIFVHIPKTGGTTIESLIWSNEEKTEENLWMGFVDKYSNKYQTGGLQHLLAKQIFCEVGKEIFLNSYKFSMVRNPFDRIVSQFESMKQRRDLRDFIGMNASDSFDRYLDLIKNKKHVQWEPQWKFLYDDEGHKIVDKVMRFENFKLEVSSLLKSFNIKIDEIPWLNRSGRKKTEYYYCDSSYEKVRNMYKRDFELLEYSERLEKSR